MDGADSAQTFFFLLCEKTAQDFFRFKSFGGFKSKESASPRLLGKFAILDNFVKFGYKRF